MLFSTLLIIAVVVTLLAVNDKVDKKPLWRFETLGSVYAAPILANGYLYTNSYFDQSTEGGIYCLNASTGSVIWQKMCNTTNNYDRVLALELHGNYLYYSSEFTGINCLDALTGKPIWNTTSDTHIIPPAIEDGYLYARNNDNFYAFNASNGDAIWSQPLGKEAYGQLVDNGDIYILKQNTETSALGTVYSLNASNGEINWNYSIPEYTGILSVSGNNAYVTSYADDYAASNPEYIGNLYVFAKNTGQKKWNFTTELFQSISPDANARPVMQLLVSNSTIYFGFGNRLYALDASSGSKLWNRTTQSVQYSHLALNSLLYVSAGSISENGHGSLIALDASTGATKWNFQLSSRYASSPTFVGNQVIVGTSDSMFFSKNNHQVYSIDKLSGKQLWVNTITGNPVGLTTDKGVLYIGAEFSTSESRDFEGNGYIYAISMN